jgi:hypothetical protein
MPPEVFQSMTRETQDLLIREHDRLVAEYNQTEKPELLDEIAVLEMALIANEVEA